MYSQNNEDKIVSDYFGSHIGTVLSIGENDGKTLSNVLALIEKGWCGCLIEPAKTAFERLVELHKERPNISCYNYAIGRINGEVDFWDSGAHLTESDTSLLSTLDEKELERWKGTNNQFVKTTTKCVNFKTFYEESDWKTFDFITIDAEGLDYEILKQIDLQETKTKCVCIEYNNDPVAQAALILYMKPLGFHVIHTNWQNIIFAK